MSQKTSTLFKKRGSPRRACLHGFTSEDLIDLRKDNSYVVWSTITLVLLAIGWLLTFLQVLPGLAFVLILMISLIVIICGARTGE